ncbi:tripartite tricarboxylate transporter TctB family protein [Geosporobacter ferrireducens]|uniref:DUF1468 domain-containing protein n=1 Tax=Geosporobacter ferrireducens TaxID=1424294 RepID=A0A1D8GMB8_9FIRM|nr:tripartite tricarboxylate transporter TctB family protein [Geosporobacter ferrireducens]AOT72079.1 hypothetical protein Gferi_22590 [Geosporobacter ferrireducens]MTI55963.1 tripartite tricarboxylate transporter TctB family protein [Geosporobacter ferrireducens]
MLNRYREAIYGIVFFIIAAAYYAASFNIKIYQSYGDSGVDSRFLPQLLGIFLMILSTIQIVKGIKLVRIYEGDRVAEKIISIKVILTVAFIVLYVALMPVVGFLIMTAVYLFFQIILLMPPDNKKYLLALEISTIFSIVVYFLFVQVLTLILPRGILG